MAEWQALYFDTKEAAPEVKELIRNTLLPFQKEGFSVTDNSITIYAANNMDPLSRESMRAPYNQALEEISGKLANGQSVTATFCYAHKPQCDILVTNESTQLVAGYKMVFPDVEELEEGMEEYKRYDIAPPEDLISPELERE